MNKVFLTGHLGADPEGNSTNSGSYYVRARIATSRRWKTKDGEKREETDWHNLVVWGNLAEIFEQYLTKGSKVTVIGRLQTRSWEDRGGDKKYITEVIVEEMEMHGGGDSSSGDRDDRSNRSRRGGGGRDRGGNERGRNRGRSRDDGGRGRTRGKTKEEEPPEDDDDIPF